MRAGAGHDGRVILEAFKPGTSPPDSYSVIGASEYEGRQISAPPEFRPSGLYSSVQQDAP